MRQFSDLLRYTLIHSLALLIAIIWIAIVRNTMEILLYWNLILTRWNVHVHFSFETFSRLDGHLERERNLKPNNIITYVVQSRAVNGWLIHDAYINWPICRVNAGKCSTMYDIIKDSTNSWIRIFEMKRKWLGNQNAWSEIAAFIISYFRNAY
jgi:hypothetical protein